MAGTSPAMTKHFASEPGMTSKLWTGRDGGSGHVRPIGRRNHAAYHAARNLGVTAGTPNWFRFHHPPSAAIGHQGGQHGVIELVAAALRAIGAEQRQPGQREIADYVEHLV